MVLFVTGLCSRNCAFCPLSKKRKNLDVTYANERKIKNFNEIIQEVKNSNAKGCSLTGGDPLIKLDKTLDLAKKLKENFGKRFHIHIYLSTKLVTKENLEKLSQYIDEIRFHPDLNKNLDEESKKISLAKEFWKKKNIGIELPLFPDKEKEILQIINLSKKNISFVNLNELESGEISERYILRNYTLNEEGYTIKNSINFGIRLLNKLKNSNLKLNICTARTKNWHQYRNRLKNYKIHPFGKQTSEGTVIYFITPIQNKFKLNKKDFILDSKKKRLILNPLIVNKLKAQLEIFRVEEYPTFDKEEAEKEIFN